MGVCGCRLVYFLLLTLTGTFSLRQQPLSAEKEDEFAQTPSEDIYDVSCSPPAVPEHGYVVGRDYTMGSRVTVHCQPGYRLVGPQVFTCLAVPDPFHHVAIWEPQTPASCVDTASVPASPGEEAAEEDPQDDPLPESQHSSTVLLLRSSPFTNTAEVPSPPEVEPVEVEPVEVEPLEVPQSQDFPPFPRFGAIGVRRSLPSTGRQAAEHQQERCLLPLDTGSCGSGVPRFYFDHVTGECRHFLYGGCQGNDNNFLSLSDCLGACTGFH